MSKAIHMTSKISNLKSTFEKAEKVWMVEKVEPTRCEILTVFGQISKDGPHHGGRKIIRLVFFR